MNENEKQATQPKSGDLNLTPEETKIKAQSEKLRGQVAKNLMEAVTADAVQALFIVAYNKDGSFIDHMDLTGHVGEACAFSGRVGALHTQLEIHIEACLRRSSEQQVQKAARDAARADA